MGVFLFIIATFYAQVDWINGVLIPQKNTNSIYLATMNGVYKSEDSGNSFKQINIGFNNLHINSIKEDKNGRLYAGCDDGLYILKDGAWKRILDKPFVREIFISGKTIIIGTSIGDVLRSNDYGGSWNCIMNLSSPITKITSSNGRIYISSYSDGIYESYDKGKKWRRLKFEPTKIWDVLPVGNSLFIAGEQGLFKGSNTHWIPLNYGLTTNDIRVIKRDGGVFYLGSYIGGFFVSYDQGNKWHMANTRLSNTNIRDIAISGNSVYLATENGLYKTENKGQSFKRLTNGLVYLSYSEVSKAPEDIRRRKEKLGINPPLKEGEKSHGGGH